MKGDGTRLRATGFEISEGGMSAATTGELHVGDEVVLSPVMGGPVEAVVRRNQGTMYGFQFRTVPAELRERILKMCEGLPLFRSSADI